MNGPSYTMDHEVEIGYQSGPGDRFCIYPFHHRDVSLASTYIRLFIYPVKTFFPVKKENRKKITGTMPKIRATFYGASM